MAYRKTPTQRKPHRRQFNPSWRVYQSTITGHYIQTLSQKYRSQPAVVSGKSTSTTRISSGGGTLGIHDVQTYVVSQRSHPRNARYIDCHERPAGRTTNTWLMLLPSVYVSRYPICIYHSRWPLACVCCYSQWACFCRLDGYGHLLPTTPQSWLLFPSLVVCEPSFRGLHHEECTREKKTYRRKYIASSHRKFSQSFFLSR